MSNTMTIEYSGIIIAYDEKDNRWRFTLRGRDRSAESLAKAKEYIDKPKPEDKKEKPFERIKAFRFSYGGTVLVGEVTSIAERGYSNLKAWFVGPGHNRSKEAAYSLYPMTSENEALLKQWKVLEEQRLSITKDQSDIVNKMTSLAKTLGDIE
jgi:hypothetical protein